MSIIDLDGLIFGFRLLSSSLLESELSELEELEELEELVSTLVFVIGTPEFTSTMAILPVEATTGSDSSIVGVAPPKKYFDWLKTDGTDERVGHKDIK